MSAKCQKRDIGRIERMDNKIQLARRNQTSIGPVALVWGAGQCCDLPPRATPSAPLARFQHDLPDVLL